MRQLAAIMFTDLTGYTAVMQENEQLARQKRLNLKSVLESEVANHQGKILQYYGDGALSIFNSAINGVHCAVEMQKQFRNDPKIDVRIGLHVGDISIEEDAVFGDGVNLASRVETLAVPGSVLISERVFEEIKNQENIRVKEMGYFELKNVKQPVRIFAINNTALVVPSRADLAGKTTQPQNRLAVLPFVNMSADPDNEYFSDGITEELLNALTRVDGLQVISRTSAFSFKGKNDDIRDIATKLNVDRVLEGSVRKSGNRVRITAQLINAADGYHIWSENFDRNLDDIFILQDEISSIIANRLRENLAAQNRETKLVKAPTSNVEAYTLYLRGLHFGNKLNPLDARKALEYYKKAIDLEPSYANPYASLAQAYAYLGATGQMNTEAAYELALPYSEKALRLDPELSIAHVAYATISMFYNWQWKQGYESLKKAVELNPGSTEASQMLYYYHSVLGNNEEALVEMERAHAIDPLSPITNHYLANAYMLCERYDDAMRVIDHLLELNPYMRATVELKGWVFGVQGHWEKAAEIFLEVHRLTGHPLKGLTSLAYAYGKLDQKEKALECIQKIEQREKDDPGSMMDSDLALAWWGLGDKQKSLSYLQSGIDKKLGTVAFYFNSRLFEGFEQLPEYKTLKQQMNL